VIVVKGYKTAPFSSSRAIHYDHSFRCNTTTRTSTSTVRRRTSTVRQAPPRYDAAPPRYDKHLHGTTLHLHGTTSTSTKARRLFTTSTSTALALKESNGRRERCDIRQVSYNDSLTRCTNTGHYHYHYYNNNDDSSDFSLIPFTISAYPIRKLCNNVIADASPTGRRVNQGYDVCTVRYEIVLEARRKKLKPNGCLRRHTNTEHYYNHNDDSSDFSLIPSTMSAYPIRKLCNNVIADASRESDSALLVPVQIAQKGEPGVRCLYS